MKHVTITKSKVTIAESHVPMTRSNVTIGKSHVPMAKSNVTIGKSHVTIAKSEMTIAEINVTLVESHVTMTKSDVTTGKSNVTIAVRKAPLGLRKGVYALKYMKIRVEIMSHSAAPVCLYPYLASTVQAYAFCYRNVPRTRPSFGHHQHLFAPLPRKRNEAPSPISFMPPIQLSSQINQTRAFILDELMPFFKSLFLLNCGVQERSTNRHCDARSNLVSGQTCKV